MKARYQSDHERYNAMHYPGTRQVCVHCGQPTGKCEEDSFLGDDGPLCEECFDLEDVMQKYLSAPCGMIPSEAGDYYLVTDVEREMIPRPSEEEARKAVLVLLSAKDSVLYFESVFGVYSDEAEQARDKLTEASNALLRLMGVA